MSEALWIPFCAFSAMYFIRSGVADQIQGKTLFNQSVDYGLAALFTWDLITGPTTYSWILLGGLMAVITALELWVYSVALYISRRERLANNA